MQEASWYFVNVYFSLKPFPELDHEVPGHVPERSDTCYNFKHPSTLGLTQFTFNYEFNTRPLVTSSSSNNSDILNQAKKTPQTQFLNFLWTKSKKMSKQVLVGATFLFEASPTLDFDERWMNNCFQKFYFEQKVQQQQQQLITFNCLLPQSTKTQRS